MYRCYVAVLTILFCEYTTALVNHKPPVIHTNHPYLNIKENSRVVYQYEKTNNRWSVTSETGSLSAAASPNGTEFVIIDASSQTNDTVTVTTHDNATASRVFLFPTRLGINSTYRVALKKIPDREVERTWYLTFQAHDNHGDTLWTLPLHIDDVNDNAPFFEHDHYHSVVGYGLAVGSKIVHVTAIDSDEGPNAAITYSMSPYQVPSPSSRYNAFVIDPITGDITLKEDLQHGHTTYHYQVNATDNGVPKQSSSTLVNIEIFDFNALG